MGYAGGRPAIDRFGRYLLIRPHEVDRAHEWFERHGEAVAGYGRLIPLVRSFVSLPAGVAAMPFWRFTVYTLVGSLVWCVGLASIGHVFGDRWLEIERVIQPFAWVIAGIVVVALAVFVSAPVGAGPAGVRRRSTPRRTARRARNADQRFATIVQLPPDSSDLLEPGLLIHHPRPVVHGDRERQRLEPLLAGLHHA